MAALETSTNLDRIWFERHPRRRVYIRYELEGETFRAGWPIGVQGCVFVRQLRPGKRIRIVFGVFVHHAKKVTRLPEAEILGMVS